MEAARFNIFSKNKKSKKVMALPPTSPNLRQNALRSHLQVMLWKAADQQTPPAESDNINGKLRTVFPFLLWLSVTQLHLNLLMSLDVSARQMARNAVVCHAVVTSSILHAQLKMG